ncbi:MAG: hypothetical protein J2P43_15725, partial [Candidatus Dormibacteraeota bacterium]|nr:hypothetical protein [Candidatus Dormibacteraeota bacterium]
MRANAELRATLWPVTTDVIVLNGGSSSGKSSIAQ